MRDRSWRSLIPKSPSGATVYVTTRRRPGAKVRLVSGFWSAPAQNLTKSPAQNAGPVQRRWGARVGRVLERSKMGKFVRWDVLDGRLSWSFDQDKIVAEKLFDGCYIVSGEVPKEKMAASEVVASYKKLGLVEEAFRSLKTVQLEVRPVYHKTDDRIRSHVFLCTLAYYLQWHLNQRLEPLFAADGTHKDREWTMRNVIERLAAIRRDKIAMGSVEFEKVTTPEPDQETILDYLKVRL